MDVSTCRTTSKNYDAAWTQLTDPQGFSAPFRHHDRRAAAVRISARTVTAIANGTAPSGRSPRRRRSTRSRIFCAITNQSVVAKNDYFDAFLTYVHSQHADGKPYIGEYLDETTGQWINGKDGRSRYYNHSTFADLLITGVVGLVPRADDTVEVCPLLPENTWNWFCLDGVNYHGHTLTILWDKDGTRYHRGKGLIVLADGKEIAHADKLEKLTGKLP